MDLVASKPGEMIAIEVETGKSDAVNNVRKDLASGFDRVICYVLVDTMINELNKTFIQQVEDEKLWITNKSNEY